MDPVRHEQRCLERLAHLCRRWGGKLIVLPDTTEFNEVFEQGRRGGLSGDDPDLSEAPFENWHGVNWRNKIVYTTTFHTVLGAIIHEMGHVFACKSGPGIANEWAFLGWEACTARLVGCYNVWSAQNKHYGVIDDDNKHTLSAGEWGGLTLSEQRRLLRERVVAGQKAKIVSKTGRPLAIR